MTVTVTQLVETVEAVFKSSPHTQEDVDAVVFGVIAGEYKGECCIEITDNADGDDPATCLMIALFFHDENGLEYDFIGHPEETLLRFCNETDLSLIWSSLSLVQSPAGQAELQLVRTVRISSEVLQSATEQGGSCELHWALLYVYREFILVAPLIKSLASGKEINPTHIKLLLTDVKDPQYT